VSDAFAALDRALDCTSSRPELARDVEIVGFSSRLGGDHAVIHQPRSGGYYRLTGPQAALAASLDGSRSVAQLAADPGGTGVRGDEAMEVVEFLRRRGCLVQPSTDAFSVLAQRCTPAGSDRLGRTLTKLRAATITLHGVPALTDLVYRHGGRWLFTRTAQAVLVPVIVVGLVLTVTEPHEFSVLGDPSAATAVTLWLLTLIALVVHELGHALAIRHAGRRVLGAGFQLYFGNPVFFINSSDMVMAPPRARAVNAAAGPVADLVVAGLAAIVAAVVGPTTLGEICYRFAVLTFVFAAVNLFPFLELDGYWLMTDLLDLPDLRPRAWAFLRRDLRPRLRSGPPLNRGEWGLVGFALAGVVSTVGADRHRLDGPCSCSDLW
jgi:putative peptide zinc metalloprotease protein